MSAAPKLVRPRRQTLLSKLERAREIIDCYAIGQPFAETHVDEIAELSGTLLRGLWRKSNPLYPNDKRHVHALAYDWLEPEQWSWRTAIQIAHARDPQEARQARERQKVVLALRHAIKSDMEDFRHSQHPYECAVCGASNDLTTDHKKPPFSLIAGEFLKDRGPIALRDVPGHSGIIADEDLEAQWITFHAARAVYQLLCRSCNSSKGAR
jgi:5-methylcytosine-specific restriction endonuclease McrA